MPSLGADMDSGTVTRWLVGPGDAVRRGDIVAIIETDKADVEVEIFQDGTIEELLVPEGAEAAVGAPLALVDETITPASGAPSAPSGPAAAEPTAPAEPAAREAAPPARPAATEAAVPAGPAAVEPPAPEPAHRARRPRRARAGPTGSTGNGRRGRVSPRARRLGAERGVDPGAIGGTGPGGAVTGRDVEREIPGPAVEAGAPQTEARPPTAAGDRSAAMRTAIARAMARSKREIPHYYLASDIDFSRARGFLDLRNEARPATERVLPAALLLKATALAVRELPELNGHWVVDEYRPSAAVHVGVAISLRGGGLVAPAIHDTDTLSLAELMAALRDVVARARAGSLRSSEMSDPTITVTNLGDQGAQLVHGVIYPPQVALVGFGAIAERPWAADGMLGVRPVVTATLAADHRASDGARGARLLELVDRNLQRPEEL